VTETAVRARKLIGADLERCIYCNGRSIRREGKRRKKLESIQLWYCRSCERTFSPQIAKGKTYPLKVIMEALQLYYRGETRAQTSQQIQERFGIRIPARTLSTWLAELRNLTTYARLRDVVVPAFPPRRVIRWVRLHHQQVYHYGIHRGKVTALLSAREHERFQPLGEFLDAMAQSCPHGLFIAGGRASKAAMSFELDGVEIRIKRNHACRLAGFALQAVTQTRRRHDELQRFMLATDSVTVAVEVPIYLSTAELVALQRRYGLSQSDAVPSAVTGHIDFVQIRNGAIHILDYKPGARHEKPIVQLMTYALALSQRTGLDLFDFVCAWFDEDSYFEFCPRHVVEKRRRAVLRSDDQFTASSRRPA
jgi:transposase-like protein